MRKGKLSINENLYEIEFEENPSITILDFKEDGIDGIKVSQLSKGKPYKGNYKWNPLIFKGDIENKKYDSIKLIYHNLIWELKECSVEHNKINFKDCYLNE